MAVTETQTPLAKAEFRDGTTIKQEPVDLGSQQAPFPRQLKREPTQQLKPEPIQLQLKAISAAARSLPSPTLLSSLQPLYALKNSHSASWICPEVFDPIHILPSDVC